VLAGTLAAGLEKLLRTV